MRSPGQHAPRPEIPSPAGEPEKSSPLARYRYYTYERHDHESSWRGNFNDGTTQAACDLPGPVTAGGSESEPESP